MRFLIIFITAIFVIFVTYNYFDDSVNGIPQWFKDRVASVVKDIEDRASDFLASEEIEEIKREILAPAPLRAPERPATTASLNLNGVVAETNAHRANIGLPPLVVNSKLNVVASLKVQDMFDRQYFAHDSPSGEGAGDLADRAGYAYIMIGENLALGNFDGNKGLVQAWMDSPGHRANILHNRFTEIGVAVGKGTFEGRSTWLAVQEFGLPMSACPEPSPSLRVQIEANQVELEESQADLGRRKKEIDNHQPKAGPAYNSKVRAYNEKVAEYNELLEITRGMIKRYNAEVEEFNRCAGGR